MMRFLFSQRERARKAAIAASERYEAECAEWLARGECVVPEYWGYVVNAALDALGPEPEATETSNGEAAREGEAMSESEHDHGFGQSAIGLAPGFRMRGKELILRLQVCECGAWRLSADMSAGQARELAEWLSTPWSSETCTRKSQGAPSFSEVP